MLDTAKSDHPSLPPQRQEPPCGAKTDPLALAKLLDEWTRGDEAEQRETFEVLRRSLDEARPEGYKLFS
jgi:hypothetical protein